MGAMPAAGLAGLLSSASVAEGLLVERLEWAKGWTEAVHAADPDAQCREMAAACRSLQVRFRVKFKARVRARVGFSLRS
jgi:hypothetical protein